MKKLTIGQSDRVAIMVNW